MLIESTSKYLLKKTRAKAKMYEYYVPIDLHVEVEENIPDLLLIAIGVIGDVAAKIVRSKAASIIDEPEFEEKINFASNFFNAFLESRLDEENEDYYNLLGSVAFYFDSKLGSSQVLMRKIDLHELNIDANGIETALAVLLKNEETYFKPNEYDDFYQTINSKIYQLIKMNNTNMMIFEYTKYDQIRNAIYEMGSPLEILLTDAILAIIILKQNNLASIVLPKYSGIDYSQWEKSIVEGEIIKELWPSQVLLGESGVFHGTSAVIQMATGTGKTKSISLMIYSAFLANRSKLSIVVAPFRSLCREIAYNLERDFKFDENIRIEQLSDVLRADDFIINPDLNIKSVVVVTPEKLMYMIRQQEEIVNTIDQIIFDEAHLFDDSHRGIQYELLISLLRKKLPEYTQKILISAVMSNAGQLNEWINGDDGVVISSSSIKSTEKQVGFTDWRRSAGEKYGYLYFVDSENPDIEEFFVPRLIEITPLSSRPLERKTREFPQVNKDGKVLYNDVSIYYAIHLCRNGSVAIFCGKKDSANKIINRLLELKSRDYDISNIINTCDVEEVQKISNLISLNYGEDNIYFEGAKNGIFVHHSGVSNGLKISLEYAMQASLISTVICTSTLAQGVNLPIKYLVVSSLYQGREHISVRDFHNLIGRAGRAGVYTEGSILLTETGIYNSKIRNWRWTNYKRILNGENAEPCISTLIHLVKVHSFYKEREFCFYEHLLNYYIDYDKYLEFKMWLDSLSIDIAEQLRYMHGSFLSTLSSIESFIMANFEYESAEENKDFLIELLEETYGFYLASDNEKEKLVCLFDVIYNYIIEEVPEKDKRNVYSKSLLGIKLNSILEEWIWSNLEQLNSTNNELIIFEIIAQLLFENSENRKVKKIEKVQCFLDIGKLWIMGNTYEEILRCCTEKEYMIESRSRLKPLDLDDIIDITEKGLGYSTILLITGITELYSNMETSDESTYEAILNLSSSLRYGLPDQMSIIIYELGFSDRVIAQRIADEIQIPNSITEKRIVKNILRSKKNELLEIVAEYPSIYSDKLNKF